MPIKKPDAITGSMNHHPGRLWSWGGGGGAAGGSILQWREEEVQGFQK